MARPQRGARATRADDGPTLTDAAPWGAFVPPVGWMAQPPGYLGISAATPQRDRVLAFPFYVGPAGFEVDMFRWRVSTAQSGGSGLVAEVGLYRDDGTGFPSIADLVASGSSTDFTAGFKDVTFTPVTLRPGLYWVLWVWRASTAPSTSPQLSCMNNTSFAIPVPAANFGTSARGLVVARSSLPATQADFTRSMVGILGNNEVPLVALRRSA